MSAQTDPTQSDVAHSAPVPPMARVTPDLSESFYFVDIIFLVEDCLFRLPRRNFEIGSDVFRDLFALPNPPGQVAEGSSRENPLHLEGIKKVDFEQLLKVLYPLHAGKPITLSSDEWISTLKLSSMWNFDEIRQLAIDNLSKTTLDPGRKYLLALETRVTQWLVPALTELVSRQEPMAMADVDLLGVDCVLRLSSLREVCEMDAETPPRCNYVYCNTIDQEMSEPPTITYRCGSCGSTTNRAITSSSKLSHKGLADAIKSAFGLES